MSDKEKDIPEVCGEDTILTKYAEARIVTAERLVETCGCSHCREFLQSWLDWRDMVVRTNGKEIPPPPKPPGSDEVGPNHPKFGPDDPPPPFDSGNLADWYAAGL